MPRASTASKLAILMHRAGLRVDPSYHARAEGPCGLKATVAGMRAVDLCIDGAVFVTVRGESGTRAWETAFVEDLRAAIERYLRKVDERRVLAVAQATGVPVADLPDKFWLDTLCIIKETRNGIDLPSE